MAIAHAFAASFLDHPGMFGLTTQRTRSDPRVQAASVDAAEPLLKVLRSIGLDRTGSGHWLRIIWTAAYGFSYVRHLGMNTIDTDPDDSYELMVRSFVRSLEEARANRADGPHVARARTTPKQRPKATRRATS
jgi:hypothetical protein